MDNNNEHAKERALQEQFCLKKIRRVGCPFLPPHPDGCLHCWEGTNQEEVVQEGGCMGKGGLFQETFNYHEKGGNMLKHKSSVSVAPKVLWVFDLRINRFSVKPRRLGVVEESLWLLLLS